jgi:hypothetical protein
MLVKLLRLSFELLFFAGAFLRKGVDLVFADLELTLLCLKICKACLQSFNSRLHVRRLLLKFQLSSPHPPHMPACTAVVLALASSILSLASSSWIIIFSKSFMNSAFSFNAAASWCFQDSDALLERSASSCCQSRHCHSFQIAVYSARMSTISGCRQGYR